MALPDADLLILSIVRPAATGITIGTQIPADLIATVTAGTPFALVHRFGGAAVDPYWYDRATVDVQTWGKTRKIAYDTSATIRAAFLAAWVNQTTYTLGHIGAYREVNGIAELRTPDQADGIWRFQASYSLFLRPAPAI